MKGTLRAVPVALSLLPFAFSPLSLASSGLLRFAAFEWPGACPVECCGYGTMWTAKQETVASAAALVPGVTGTETSSSFTIPVGAVVRAITGTLYTIESGTARMHEDFSTDATYKDFSARHKQPVTFQAGETIVLLAPRGNGVYRIEHGGQVDHVNLMLINNADACAAAKTPCPGVKTKGPVTEWKVMVLN